MSEYLFFEEVDMLLDGLVSAPKLIVNHLLTQGDATLEELEDLFDDESKRFVEDWLRRMITHLAVVSFWYPSQERNGYELTSFAKDMIEHIDDFKNPHSSTQTAKKEET